jgi:catalase
VTLWEEIVDAMNALSGEHPGYRAAHAKGVVATGSFRATADAAAICRAPHLQGGNVETTLRFSNGGGYPDRPDADRREGRGLAVKFHLDGGGATDLISLSIPVFMVRTAEDFLEFLHARVPNPDTGELDLERIGAFLGEHPETAAALQLILPALTPPRSYATVAYNALHAFRFLDADGEARHGRYRWVPEAGEESLGDEEIEAADRDYLQHELRKRLGSGPVRFTLELKLAGEEDPLDDPTVPWPEDRETVVLGGLEVSELIEEPLDPPLVNDPMRLCDGIEPSEDRILAARPHAYSVSVERRLAARPAPG